MRTARLVLAANSAFIFLATGATTVAAAEQLTNNRAPIASTASVEAAKALPQEPSASSEAATAQVEPGKARTRLQLGVALKSTLTPGIDTASSIKPTLAWRWRGASRRDEDHWSPAFSFGSFDSRVSRQVGAAELPVGDVKVRPLMAGLDYKMPRGKLHWTLGLSAGWAINHVSTPGDYAARVARSVGADDLWVDVHNSFVWGPRLTVWFERDQRVSYLVKAAYLVTRPEMDLRVRGITSTRRLNADAVIISFGIVYGVF